MSMAITASSPRQVMALNRGSYININMFTIMTASLSAVYLYVYIHGSEQVHDAYNCSEHRQNILPKLVDSLSAPDKLCRMLQHDKEVDDCDV